MANEQNNSKVDRSLLWKEFPQFEGSDVRVDADTKTASVLDVMALVLGTSNAAKCAWVDLRKSTDLAIQKLVSEGHQLIRINGKGKLTPVAPFRTLLEIIYLLPGKRAHEFRRTSARYMARLLSGDLSLIEEIEARYDASTPEEREFFRNGTDETPGRKRRREEMEYERARRVKREEAEIERMLLENDRMKEETGRMKVENIKSYRSLLEDFGLDRDPRMRMLLNDTVANIMLPIGNRKTVEGSALMGYVTIGKFLVDHGIKDKSPSALGRMLARFWREEEGCEPEETVMMVQGDMRPVKVYPVSFLEKHVLG